MRKIFLTIVSVILSLTVFVAGCSMGDIRSESGEGSNLGDSSTVLEDQGGASTEQAVKDDSITAAETDAEFVIATKDGDYVEADGVYTISAAGTYTISGLLNGQILVDAGEDDVVELDLTGTTIKNAQDSPIKILSADKVEISAKKDTENVILDERTADGTYASDVGKGAIYAKTDLKLKGAGTLLIVSNYNNGVHTTKDLTIQKLSLKVEAANNAIKGNDSITVNSGKIVAVSYSGDGIKTENTDANKSGETRGDIILNGGSVAVYAAGDGIQAAHNFVMQSDGDGNSANVTVYTGAYSDYTSSSSTEDSFKGIKVENQLNILAGTVYIKSYDDGLHANYGTVFETGETGEGVINLSGGEITISVYSPEKATAGGKMGPSFNGSMPNRPFVASEYAFNQPTVKGADGIHADHTLQVSGGVINVDSAFEGLEATQILITGGKTYVKANDDGLNAAQKVSTLTPQITISGGYLDVAVSSNGDMDGIDSNGNYVQTGGIVIVRGPNSEMAAAIDYGDNKNSATISGGTLIVIGYANVKTSDSVRQYSLSLHSSGSHTVTIDGEQYSFTNDGVYARTYCYSDVSVSA